MKSQWPIWVFILGVIAIVLFAFNYRGNEELVSLSEIFPEDDISKLPDIEYDFVNDASEGQEQAAAQVAQAQDAAPLAQPAAAAADGAPASTVSIGIGQEPTATTAKADVEKAAAPTEAVAKAAAAAPAEFGDPKFTIQVASAKDKDAAEAQVKTIKAAGHPAYIVRKDLGEKGVWFRIYVGRFETKQAANDYLTKVKGSYHDSFIISP